VSVAVPGALVGQASKISRVPADFTSMTTLEDIALVPALPAAGPRVEANLDGSQDVIMFAQNLSLPNGFALRESDGTLFFSDSIQGAIFAIADPSQQGNVCPGASDCVDLVNRDPLLSSIGTPQVGANGLAFNAAETALFIANTGDDRLLRLDMVSGGLTVFLNGINGPDGVISGPSNTLIATANQADQVVVIDADTGSVLAELGEFFGTRKDGTAIGLSGPASVVQLNRSLFVTNPGRPVPAGQVQPPDTIALILLPDAILRRDDRVRVVDPEPAPAPAPDPRAPAAPGADAPDADPGVPDPDTLPEDANL
jgi:hypothetical protein